MPANASTTPLIKRNADSLIACVGDEFVSSDQFCQQINWLLDRLPDQHYVINICKDRFNFQRSMAAVIGAHKCNLLPPNRQIETLEALSRQYPDSYVLFDDDSYTPDSLDAFDLRLLTKDMPLNQKPSSASPVVKDSHIAAISFTSGSTGESQPNIKTWSMLHQGNEINIDNMLYGAPKGLHILSTVPPQHMYGLELSILLPMTADVCVHSGQPLYPADVQQALEHMPEPRCLVSTPQHLRALVGSGLEFPPVERLFSATAPLSASSAKSAEQTFGGTLIEIFGCSEIGSLARRQTTTDTNWTPFSAMTIRKLDDRAWVQAPHIDEEIELQDVITINLDGTFTITGRLADLVNIAGKRGSLTHINQLLLAIPCVDDGIVFQPDESLAKNSQDRLAAIVVAPKIDKAQLIRKLKRNLDPVFMPRPILFTDSLPRNETGKLPRKTLLELFARLKDSNSI